LINAKFEAKSELTILRKLEELSVYGKQKIKVHYRFKPSIFFFFTITRATWAEGEISRKCLRVNILSFIILLLFY
jgi:hypothetical protein